MERSQFTNLSQIRQASGQLAPFSVEHACFTWVERFSLDVCGCSHSIMFPLVTF